MSNTSFNLVNLDFASFKNQLKLYLKSQDIFKDYDFEGSNMSVLLDVLSYNTYNNAFYLNMIGNEMFLDSALLRDSVVSHAKVLNYLPRSFKSARAIVDISVSGGNTQITSITAPKGTSFTSRIGSNNYTFVIDQNLILKGSNGTYTASNVDLYEGRYFTESFVIDYANTSQKFILNNQTIDTDSLTVSVIEDNGANIVSYISATSLLNQSSNSLIYFIQAAQNEKYEIIFGDGISGRKPKDNSILVCEYRVTNGELPNGAFKFVSDGTIGGLANVSVSTVTAAIGGAISESIESIKFNAPRYFSTQERAVTTEDYENLLKINYPEVLAVAAYGGEEVEPPQYGRVFVAVDIDQVDGIPDSKKHEYYNFIKSRAPVSIEPIIVEPDFTYIYVDSLVRYNINTTTLAPSDIEAIVLSAISTYAEIYLNDFKKTMRYSQFVTVIDDSNENIISNETEIEAIKKLNPTLNTNQSFVVNFALEIEKEIVQGSVRHEGKSTTAIFSTDFVYQGKIVHIEDDGNGTLNLIASASGALVTPIGVVDYTLGKLNINNFNIESYFGSALKIYARTLLKDISTVKSTILRIDSEDVNIAVEQVRV